MGIISTEKAERLYWLGRYTERAFTTIKFFFEYFDQMIDRDENAYQNYCLRMGIPDIYGDKDTFSVKYLYDAGNANSIFSSLERAYDNAITVRDELSSTALSYLEMSLNLVRSHASSGRPVYDFQYILDCLYAFWGALDDCVEDEECRNIIKSGRYQERLDLIIRFEDPYATIARELERFVHRLQLTRLNYREAKIELLKDILSKADWKEYYSDAIQALNQVMA